MHITMDELIEQSVAITNTIESELFETKEAKDFPHKVKEVTLDIIVDFCERNDIIIESE
jgi:hypothetical protein